ncbi:sulfatase-like hydrolase/transferase [Telluribacter humicola]|uniref:sulfatase-like hydrolase/transferase n=1 Tax=Telluribacter humicola TaxID=1720261 RepID=UPI001A95DBC4|nr:sulfatase-like hydrolase/transferase [Telluribacter humicola]
MKYCLLLVVLAAGLAFRLPQQPADTRPNIIWITCEDMSPEHLASYGSKLTRTPHTDRLAAEGIRYTNTYSISGVCAPSRSSLITGMYQTSIGTQNMRTLALSANAKDDYPAGFVSYSAVLPQGVKCFSEYLREAGYYCTNNVKQDYQFEAPVTAWDESSPRAHWRNGTKSKSGGKPFFAIFNFTTTHESQVWSREQEPLLVRPEDVVVPIYYPDTPKVRHDIARHQSNVMRMDAQVGEVMEQLEEDGLLDNTIVFFYSDHGDGLPFVKREVYDRGLKVPLIVRFPDKRGAGTTDSQLISFVDFAPTALSLAGVPIPKHMQGQAFLGNQKATTPRRYIYAARDRMDSEIDRVRAVRDQRYKYIRNYQPEKPFYQNIKYRLQQPGMQDIIRLRDEGKLNRTQMRWFQTKPKEELYDCEADPMEFTNLAEKPEMQAKLNELRKKMDEWQKRYGDYGDMPEMDMVRKWWGTSDLSKGAPVTATPVVQRKGERVAIKSATPGASIGYRFTNSGPWSVYTGPFSIEGDTLYLIAHRIGYTPSVVKAEKLAR